MKDVLVGLTVFVLALCQSLPNATRGGKLEGIATGSTRIVDLTHMLNPQSPYWPGPGYERLSKDFTVHHITHGKGKYSLENVANLDALPAAGAFVVAAPIKIERGTGGPAPIFALVDEL